MSVTVNLEDFNKGSEPGLHKLQLLTEAVRELQGEVINIEGIIGTGFSDVIVTGCLNGLRAAGIAPYRSIPVPIDD